MDLKVTVLKALLHAQILLQYLVKFRTQQSDLWACVAFTATAEE